MWAKGTERVIGASIDSEHRQRVASGIIYCTVMLV